MWGHFQVSIILLHRLLANAKNMFTFKMDLFGSYQFNLVEKAMAPNSSTLAWKIPWMEEPRRLQSMWSLTVRHDWATSLSRIGEGNGNPLQYSCLENPRDGRAWWAAVYGVKQSQTWLKWLSSSSLIWRWNLASLIMGLDIICLLKGCKIKSTSTTIKCSYYFQRCWFILPRVESEHWHCKC